MPHPITTILVPILSSVRRFARRRCAALAAVVVAASAAPLSAQEFPACGAFPIGEESYACTCAAGADGSVWGSGPYTADSNICAAARHQGVIGPDGGAVLAIGMAGQESYTGSERNGVTTRDWGSYGTSFQFEPKGPRPISAALPACGPFDTTLEMMECSCPPGSGTGSVWGSDPYTADSDICAAALHAGYISAEGGAVRVLRTAGLERYAGSEYAGIVSRDWGSYGTSFVFDWN